MPLTLQITLVSVELETLAVNASVSPSNTVPELGVTMTWMEGGGGGGGVTEPAPPPPQLRVHAPIARRTQTKANRRTFGAVILCVVFLTEVLASRVCGRGRMLSAIEGEGQAKSPCPRFLARSESELRNATNVFGSMYLEFLM